MSFEVAMIIGMSIFASGIISLMIKLSIKKKTEKKLPLVLCNIWCVLSILIYISFLLAPTFKHYNSRIYYKEYSVDKVTLSSVYFNNDSKRFDNAFNVIL